MTVRMIRVDDGKFGDIHPDEVSNLIACGWRVVEDANPISPVPGAGSVVIDIPENWQSLHWKQRVALAEKLNGDAGIVQAGGQTQADAADAVIAAEVARRAC